MVITSTSWIKYLEIYNVSFSMHIIETDDSIILCDTRNYGQFVVVLEGFLQLLHIFTNGEIICKKLLSKHGILAAADKSYILHDKSYYRATALITTVVVIVSLKNLNPSINVDCITNLYHLHNLYASLMVDILCHRNTKKRIVHFLLMMARNFGYVNKSKIIIPIALSQYNIGIVIGSQRANVAKIMRFLKLKQIIVYNSHFITINNVLELMNI